MRVGGGILIRTNSSGLNSLKCAYNIVLIEAAMTLDVPVT